jgi:hypothetical protein
VTTDYEEHLNALLGEAWAERDALKEEVARLRAHVDRMEVDHLRDLAAANEVEVERDRLRAALAGTPENIGWIVDEMESGPACSREGFAIMLLAAFRAKADIP